MNEFKNIDFFCLESAIWIANRTLNVPAYDFRFEPLFKINRPRIETEVELAARIGAINDYDNLYASMLDYGFKLVNNPDQHKLASNLESWYPHLKGLTPKSVVYDQFPTLDEFQKDFTFPVFIKGNRQTSKHNPELSIAKSEADFNRIKTAYQNDKILHWQKVVFREFIPLKPLQHTAKDKVQISYEFRTFWWKKNRVGAGHYWSQYLDYNWTASEEKEAIVLANSAAQKLDVPFLVIDLAMTAENKWIIIECNDAQESGYCGVKPFALWQKIIAIEK